MAKNSKNPSYAADPMVEPETYTLWGTPTITLLHQTPNTWRVSAVVSVYGQKLRREVIRDFSKLHHAQDTVRQLALNARQIRQEWDQVPVGRLPQ